jgi:hypothetical protein
MDDFNRYNRVDDFFWQVIEEQERYTEQQLHAKNHDVYEIRLTDKKWDNFKLTPYSMFFYYVRVNRDGKIVIDHYFYTQGKEIPYEEKGLTELVRDLAINARPRVKPWLKNPKKGREGDFKLTPWDRISYIAIFFDEAHWKLRKKTKPPTLESAVTFIVNEGTKQGTPNHTFFDAMDLKIMMPIGGKLKPGDPTEDERSAIVFVNHLKRNEDGDDLGKDGTEKQSFTFKMLLDVTNDFGGPPTVIIVDPGGENEGPGVRPPP